jgi:hypothetical protein
MTATAHGLSIGDVLYAQGFFSSPMAFHVAQPITVTGIVDANHFIVNVNDSDTTPQTEGQATVNKNSGTNCSGKIKWEIVNTGTNTTETYKLQSIDGTQDTGFVSAPVITSTTGVVRFTIGPVEGTGSWTGDTFLGTFALNSTVKFALKATSVDDPTKSVTMTYLVAANGGGYAGLHGKAFALPGYRTIYKNRYVPLVAQVRGNVNQMVNWTIESAPAGGDATLQFATYPQAVLYSGTVSGLYRFKACPAVDSSPSACAHVSVWVSASSPPTQNTDRVEQVPCDTGAGSTVMGVTWGSILDIGKPGSPTPDLLSIPITPTGPVLLRLWNNDTVGGNPTAYHNQVQFNKPTGGPFTDQRPAFLMCGVANQTTGELPVIDADHATYNSWASQYVIGPYNVFGIIDTTGQLYPTGQTQPFSYIAIEGIHIRNVNQGYVYYSVQDGTLQPWGEATGIKPINAIQNYSMIGNRLERVSNGIFDDCNSQNNGVSHCVLDTFSEGNHLSDYGYPTTFTAHAFYKQALGSWDGLNLLDGAISGSLGTGMYSDRGTRSFHMYSRFVTNDANRQGSVIGGHSENQDAYNFLNADEYWGLNGNGNCGTYYSVSPACQAIHDGSTNLNWFDYYAALVEEHNRTDFLIGNAISVPNVYKSLGIEMTHSFWSYQPYFVGGWNREWFPENLSQNYFITYNTLEYANPSSVQSGQNLLVEDTRLLVQDVGETVSYLMQPQYYPEVYMQNNIIPMAKQTFCDYGCNLLNVNAHQISHYTTNMFGGIVTPAGNFDSNPNAFSTNGWFLIPHFSDWGNINPIVGSGGHVTGWTAPNFLTYSSYPIQQPSLVPPFTSPAVGAASACQGETCYYPPRFNAVDPLMSPFTLRTDLTTLGAYDPNGGPTLSFITVTPSPMSVVVGAFGQLTATCTYSDSSVSNCTAVAVWSNTGSAFHMDSGIPGQVDADSIGSGTATATIGAIHGNATVNVIAAPPHIPMGGPIKDGGPFKIVFH